MSTVYWFGHYGIYSTEEEKEECRKYLNLWKDQQLKNLHRETYSAEVVDEIWNERVDLSTVLCQRSFLILKIAIKIKFNFQINHLPPGVQSTDFLCSEKKG